MMDKDVESNRHTIIAETIVLPAWTKEPAVWARERIGRASHRAMLAGEGMAEDGEQNEE